MSTQRYRNLFSTIRIGNMEIKNRFVIPAMETNLCNPDCTVSERYINYWEARARGGWGLLITGVVAIAPEGKAGPFQLGLFDDSNIGGFRKITAVTREHGAKIMAQLHHAGRQTFSMVIGSPPVAPSAVPCPICRDIPRELTTEEIYGLIEKFGDAAVRAREAGFDGVEVHGAHGYLVAQFMSGYANKRTDEFGGSFENMMRFPLAIIKNIRSKTGNDFPLQFRLSAEEKVPGGRSINESRMAARLLEEAGIDSLSVSVGVYATSHYIQAPGSMPPGLLLPAAEKVKQVVSIPVVAVGRINHPLLAEDAIQSGRADLLAWGRQSLADPELPNKVAADKFKEVAPCIACNQGCIGYVMQVKPVSCLVNPFCGREGEMKVEPAEKVKKVVVVGAGPAGLETAWIAASRGHQVVLFEKNEAVGGQFKTAAVPPAKQDISKALYFLTAKCLDSGVDLRIGVKAASENILAENPDAVVLATGGEPLRPEISGLNESGAVNALDVLEGKVQVKGNVLIVGGGTVGCETADFLAERGLRVTIVEALPKIGRDVEPPVRYFLMQRLKQYAVRVITGSEVVKLFPDGAQIEKEGRKEELRGYKQVIMALGVKPADILKEQLEGKVPELCLIGDARTPARAIDAVAEGAETALKL